MRGRMDQSGADDKLESLLWRYRSGDADAFREIYRRTKPLIQRYLRQKLRDPGDVDDVFQETFFRIHRYIATYDPEKGGFSWILTVARHAMLKRIQTLSAHGMHAAISEADLRSKDNPAEALEIKSLLQDLCKDVPAVDIELLFRRIFLDASFGEIADELEISQPSLRQRYSRLMRRFRSSNP